VVREVRAHEAHGAEPHAARHRLRATYASLALLLLVSCDLAPPRDDEGGPQVITTTPADGERMVRRRGPFVARFDRRLLPRTVSRATVRLESGVVRPLLSVTYDVLTQSVVAVPFSDEPIAEDVGWRLVLEGVEDLDGRAMPQAHTVQFRTGRDVGPDRVQPVALTFADVAPIFTARCAGAACHGPGPAALGLDLSSARAVRETAINRPSRSFPSGVIGPAGGAGAPVFAGLPLIEVTAGAGRPETSYLVYTVLGDPHIAGSPMPPALRDDPGAGLTPDELRTIAAWISAGAPTEGS